MKKGNKLDVAIIDPPRKVCELPALDALITSESEKIVYVSCGVNPEDKGLVARYV